MGRIGPVIGPGAKLGQYAAERILAGVTAENYGRFARPGGVVVHSNHPAFIVGHLALYPQRILQQLGQPVGSAAVPAGYEMLFKFGVECQDDIEGTIYPPFEELKTRFFEGYRAAIAAVEAAPDEAFDVPNPAEGRLRELFPKLGAAINFYLVGHVQVHLGQLSAWRRAMGMPAA
jgi:hypothetical protein